MIFNKLTHTHIQKLRDGDRDNRHKYFYVVNLRRGNIHGLNPQPPAKQIHYMKRTYTLKTINSVISIPSYQILIYPQANESLSLLPIQGVSYTSRKQLLIKDSLASRKISLLSNLDH